MGPILMRNSAYITISLALELNTQHQFHIVCRCRLDLCPFCRFRIPVRQLSSYTCRAITFPIYGCQNCSFSKHLKVFFFYSVRFVFVFALLLMLFSVTHAHVASLYLYVYATAGEIGTNISSAHFRSASGGKCDGSWLNVEPILMSHNNTHIGIVVLLVPNVLHSLSSPLSSLKYSQLLISTPM